MVHEKKTLRLLMPQWQGADGGGMEYPGQVYPLGARLLAFLAPESDSPLVEVPVEPYVGAERPIENGVAWQGVVLKQLRAARNIIDAYEPDRIIMFGGDCSVNQAPFAYLNERFGGKVGILWFDAHPDITTPKNYRGAHTFVLGNLLGHGDPVLAQEVKVPYKPEQVLLVGVHSVLPHEAETIKELGLRVVPAEDIAESSDAVTGWIRDNGFEHVVIHVDLDVLELKSFRSQFLWNSLEEVTIETAAGKIAIPQLTRLVKDVAAAVDVAGFGFTEHLPWDAVHLKNMMEALPFMK